ncbi:DUF4139 domain-containing protein [Nitratireductor aquimarinus]|uniref:DUF4139 domain-containing protein n=1 Tax=Nitratireductor aquimarinus TaxID=889300 RepID=A0ABU4AHN9_9HYPH|nr:DUF4139 domain-containing protein [Nitratireductor aquimarinus]MDV6225744.1 DUF4139 domain-containing protein [Nitratireductor aquimarinus]
MTSKKPQNVTREIARAALFGACFAFAAAAQPAFAEVADSGRIEAITLSSGGLAEIRRTARIDGNGTLRIEIPLDQVDDFLKSLVVRDPSGTIDAVTLDGLSPVEETFRRLPFNASEMGSVPALAAALQGVAVRATSGGRTVEGMILGVDTQQAGSEAAPRTERVLSVMTEAGTVEMLKLGTDTELDIRDEAMREKLRQAAKVSGRGRTDTIRSVAIDLTGTGVRDITLSYVVPAPVWKSAYRLVSGEGEKARLQAWAVIENATGEDWRGIGLTLSSGAPVTLAQRLHQRYWNARPEIPVAVGNAAPPRPDDSSAIEMSEMDVMPRRNRAFGAAPAPAMMADMAMPMPSEPTDRSLPREGKTSATYRLPNAIDLAAGKSLSVPFVDAEIRAERVSLFQPEGRSIHPVAAVFLSNDTEASLPPGIVTVYDTVSGYVGDAQLTGIPAGESRMASFASDRKVEITTQTNPDERVSEVSIVDGTLHTTTVSRITTSYAIKGAPDAPRTILIEHPRRDGWKMASTALDSATPSHYRLRAKVDAGGKASVKAVMERSHTESFALFDASADAVYVWAGTAADTTTTERLRTLAAMKREAATAERKVENIQRELERTTGDQARIRDNLGSVPGESALGQRYMRMLEEQENRIAGLSDRRSDAEAELQRLEKDMRDFIAKL